jgi:hypothetical protein
MARKQYRLGRFASGSSCLLVKPRIVEYLCSGWRPGVQNCVEVNPAFGGWLLPLYTVYVSHRPTRVPCSCLLLRSALFWDITRRRVVITDVSGQRICPIFTGHRDSWPVKMGSIRCPETSVNNYHTTPCNIPEERRSHQYSGGSLKSCLLFVCVLSQ